MFFISGKVRKIIIIAIFFIIELILQFFLIYKMRIV